MKQTHSGVWVPNHLKPARKFIAIVFWFSKKLDHIRIGLPEQYPVPEILKQQGYEKIVCRSVNEVVKWDKKMRDQERRQDEQHGEKRDSFERPILDAMRKDLLHRMANARNAINREFCRQALAQMDRYDELRQKEKHESVMHVEAFEDGK